MSERRPSGSRSRSGTGYCTAATGSGGGSGASAGAGAGAMLGAGAGASARFCSVASTHWAISIAACATRNGSTLGVPVVAHAGTQLMAAASANEASLASMRRWYRAKENPRYPGGG